MIFGKKKAEPKAEEKVEEKVEDATPQKRVPRRVLVSFGDIYGGGFSTAQPQSPAEAKWLTGIVEKIPYMTPKNIDVPEGFVYEAVGVIYRLKKIEDEDIEKTEEDEKDIEKINEEEI